MFTVTELGKLPRVAQTHHPTETNSQNIPEPFLSIHTKIRTEIGKLHRVAVTLQPT
jgi:hypothetical protein